MIDLKCYLTNLLFLDIALLYYYTSINSSISCCIFSGNICLSFSMSSSLLIVFKLFCEVFETFVILPAILLPTESPVASAVF